MDILKRLKEHRFFIQCLSIIVSALIAISTFPTNIINVEADEPEIWDGNAATNFAGGEGTQSSPFLIENANQLYKMVKEYHTYAASYGKYFKITKDIYINDVSDGTSIKDLSNKQNWLAGYGSTIATASKANSFNGTLDGGNNTIYGLYVQGVKNAGLFPAVASYAVIQNLNFDNLLITGGSGYGGAIAGQAIYYTWKSGVKIINCSVTNATIGQSQNIEMAGGFFGNMNNCTITFTNCYSYGLSLSNWESKGIPGGIVGSAWNDGTLNIVNSYSIGYFPTNSKVSKAICTNVYTDTAVPEGNTTANVTVLESAQMQGENAKQNMVGFDFDRTWMTVEESYPVHFVYVRPDYVWDGTKADEFAGGSGTKSDPYLIANGGQLYKMVYEYSNAPTASGSENTTTYFKLSNDIYLNDVKEKDLENPTLENWDAKFSPWYSVANKNSGFCGDLDGDGHTVYGLYCNNKRFSGLVSMLADGGSIHNLNLKNSFIKGYESAGGIAGYVYSHYTLAPATVSYCTVDNTVIQSGGKQLAGIIGGCNDIGLTISDCSVTRTSITSTNSENPNLASGLIGYGWGGTKKAINCFTDSSVHPVNSTTDQSSFDTIDNFVTYKNVYTSSAKIFDAAEGVTYLTEEQMKGNKAKQYMKGFDFDSIWATVENAFPVLNVNLSDIWDGSKAESFAGGNGTESDPYLIENGGQLYKMVSEYSNTDVSTKPTSHTYFKITKDINLGNKQWYTSGITNHPSTTSAYTQGFSGIIYGDGHTIKNLYNNVVAACVGLIPVATHGAEIHDLHLENGNLPKAAWNVYAVGAFIGLAKGVGNSKPIVIKGCSVKNFEIESRDASSAFVGYIYSQSVGIYNSYCIDSKISHTAESTANTGAFIGYTNGNDWGNSIIISNAYCVDVSPMPYLDDNFKAITSFDNVYTNDSSYDNSVSGITKLSTDQMKGENAEQYMTGFDFERTWKTVEDGYPVHFKYVRPSHIWDGKIADSFAGGTGTPSDPYLIENGGQLYKMVKEYSNAQTASGSQNKISYFKLINDIYLNDVSEKDLQNPTIESWNSKYSSWYGVSNKNLGFCGDLDGDGYTVYGLYCNNTRFPGLVPMLADGGSIHNLNLKDSFIKGYESAGGIVGYAYSHYTLAPVTVSYCTVDNSTIISGGKQAGGIIGGCNDVGLTVSNCSVTRTKVTSTNSENPNLASGLIGYGWGGTKKAINCFTDSSVHPVTASTDKTAFDTIDNFVAYTNVYTSSKKNFEALEGVKYLADDSKLKGITAGETLKEFNFTYDWALVENDYPIIRKGAGNWLYDTNSAGEVWSGKVSRFYDSGEGTKEAPFVIKTGGQLALLANDALNGKTANKYYKITEDIILNDTSSKNWQDKANEWYTGKWAQAFRGYLDGGYHTVSGLYLNKTKDNYTGTDYYSGLFACIGKNAVIEKLGIVNSSLTFTDAVSQRYVGVFAGFVDQYDNSSNKASFEEYPIIRECFADTTVFLSANSCGGFIGCATRPIRVEDSFFTGKVNSTARGLFGYAKMGYEVDEVLIKNFYTADSKYAVLSNASYDNIKCENCYSSSAQDKEGLTRLFIDRMVGKVAKEYMTGFDFKKVWSIRGDNETPGLKGFNAKAYSNVMSPEDIVVSFETNCDLMVESITGKAYSKLSLPVISREGYVFEGWYAFPELDVPFDYDYFPTFDTILYAKWTLSGLLQDFEQYEDSIYDYHEGYEYYRPTSFDYSAEYVHSGAKSMHRLGTSNEELDFLLFYEEELEVGKAYKMVYYTTTDQDNASVELSMVHLDWPDVYCKNNGVAKIAKLDNLKNGEWQENSYTFVAKSKWIAIRTSSEDSVYFDDFILYNTDEKVKDNAIVENTLKPNDTQISKPDNEEKVESNPDDTDASKSENPNNSVSSKPDKSDVSSAQTGNNLLIVIVAIAAAVVLLGTGITIFLIKKRNKK